MWYDPPSMSGRNSALRVAIVVSRFNEPVTRRLLDSAAKTLASRGVPASHQEVVWVAGAFEIPQAVQFIAARRRARPDAVVALGCVVQGETDHHAHLGRAVVDHLLAVARETGVPVGLGVITARNAQQALERAGGTRGNRGADAAEAALELVALRDKSGRSR